MPELPRDEVPALSPEDALRVLQAMVGMKSMLVGGQAVAWWFDRYQRGIPELRDVPHMFVSGDVDFLGSRADAQSCAERLHGKVHLPDLMQLVSPSVNTAVVSWEDSQGHHRRVDFLGSVHGLERRDVENLAVPFELGGGILFVLHPVLTLISRFANCVSLPGYDDDRHIEQARVSVFTAREWLEELAASEPRAALKDIERLFRFASRHDHATLAWKRFGLEAFDAIIEFDGLPEQFASTRYPQMQEELLRARGQAPGQ